MDFLSYIRWGRTEVRVHRGPPNFFFRNDASSVAIAKLCKRQEKVSSFFPLRHTRKSDHIFLRGHGNSGDALLVFF